MTDTWVVSRSDRQPDAEFASEFAAMVRKRAIEASDPAVGVVVWGRAIEGDGEAA